MRTRKTLGYPVGPPPCPRVQWPSRPTSGTGFWLHLHLRPVPSRVAQTHTAHMPTRGWVLGESPPSLGLGEGGTRHQLSPRQQGGVTRPMRPLPLSPPPPPVQDPMAGLKQAVPPSDGSRSQAEKNLVAEQWPRAQPVPRWEVASMLQRDLMESCPLPPCHLPQGSPPTYPPPQPAPAHTGAHPRPGPALLAPENTPGGPPWSQAHLSAPDGCCSHPPLLASVSPSAVCPSHLHALLACLPHLSGRAALSHPPSLPLSPLSCLLTLPFSSSSPGGTLIAGVPGAIAPPTTEAPAAPGTEAPCGEGGSPLRSRSPCGDPPGAKKGSW